MFFFLKGVGYFKKGGKFAPRLGTKHSEQLKKASLAQLVRASDC